MYTLKHLLVICSCTNIPRQPLMRWSRSIVLTVLLLTLLLNLIQDHTKRGLERTEKEKVWKEEKILSRMTDTLLDTLTRTHTIKLIELAVIYRRTRSSAKTFDLDDCPQNNGRLEIQVFLQIFERDCPLKICYLSFTRFSF